MPLKVESIENYERDSCFIGQVNEKKKAHGIGFLACYDLGNLISNIVFKIGLFENGILVEEYGHIFNHDVTGSLIIMDATIQQNLEGLLSDDHKIGQLLYRGSRDGFKAQDFHEKCDRQGKTLVVVRSQKGNIFGGFSDIEWRSRNHKVHDTARKSFLFVVRDHDKTVVKLPMREEKTKEIQDFSTEGPTFGSSDLRIENNCNIISSFARPITYEKHPDYEYFDQGDDHYFMVQEIEVF